MMGVFRSPSISAMALLLIFSVNSHNSLNFPELVSCVYNARTDGCMKKRKLYRIITVPQHLQWSWIGLKLRNISSISQKEQIDISRILKLPVFSPVLQKSRENIASHKGNYSRKDSAPEGSVWKHLKSSWWRFWKEPWEATALSWRKKNGIMRSPGMEYDGKMESSGSSSYGHWMLLTNSIVCRSPRIRISSPLFGILGAFMSLCCKNTILD